MRLLLVVLGVLLLASCEKTTLGPLRLYFLGSPRFTSGNKAGVGAGDTLATSLYALGDQTPGSQLTNFRVTVQYSPRREPFAYPISLSSFFARPADDPLAVYLDTTLTGRTGATDNAYDYLFTNVFGARTTSGTERWTFAATNTNKETQERSFVLAVRRGDSAAIYHDYSLRLRVPATGVSARRFLDLKSGLALPAYSVLRGPATTPDTAATAALQKLTDVIVLPNGLSLASPDASPATTPLVLSTTRWPAANRSKTRFRLTALRQADFTGLQAATDIQNAFTGTGTDYVPSLALGQVYAFRVYRSDKTTPVYGLLYVRAVPNGSTSLGLLLDVRLAKQPL